LSPVFSFALSLLVTEFARFHDAEMFTIVDIGCGDGSLIHSLYSAGPPAQYWGVDRSLERVRSRNGVQFTTNLAEVPRGGAQFVICNELFDALPFARLVMRDDHLHQLWVTERDGAIDWSEHEAEAKYNDY